MEVERAGRSTISDANACLDPALLLLLPLIQDLKAKVPNLPQADRQLQQLFGRAIAIDGSLFSVAGNVAWALRKRKGARMPMQQEDFLGACGRGKYQAK